MIQYKHFPSDITIRKPKKKRKITNVSKIVVQKWLCSTAKTPPLHK